MMKPLGDKLSKDHRITIIDLPGFGESSEPKEELTIYDYNNILEEFLEKLKI
ncbi:alpha/beta fold hydrolase, partial [Klebsiella pneumoniae]|uniref:alpha/beta fold hydrolase n=1 Tax=Klebsiella pneumoniae TaxID=573 RepID=UPI00338F01C7